MGENTINTKNKDLFNFKAFSTHRNAIYGFCALWIVCFHGIIMGKVNFPKSLTLLYDFIFMGNICVDIFLFLSAMGLYYSFSSNNKLGQFYYKRFIRLFVPFLIIYGPGIIYFTLIKQFDFVAFIENITTFAFWLNNMKGPSYWYVAAIVVMYLLYPLIHKFIYLSNKGSFLRTVILVLFFIAISIVIYSCFHNYYKIVDTAITRFPIFVFGAYCGSLVKKQTKYPWWVLIICLIIVILAFPLYSEKILGGIARRYMGTLTGLAMCFLLSQFMILISKIKIDKFFSFFGVFSLEIYLSHIQLRYLYMKSDFYTDHVLQKYVLVAIISLLIAYLISLLEKPINRLLLKPLNKQKQITKGA